MKDTFFSYQSNLMDDLSQTLNQRLREIPGYDKYPEEITLAIAREDLGLISNALRSRDSGPFMRVIEARVRERMSEGFDLDALLQAMGALEEVVGKQVNFLEDARFLWQVFSQAYSLISRLMYEAQSQSSETLMREVIDATPDWIFVKDRNYHFTLVNKSFATAMHMQPEELVGKDDFYLGFPEELIMGNPEKGVKGFRADDRSVLESGQTQVNSNDRVVVDGELRTLHTLKVPLRNPNGLVWGVLGFGRDITDLHSALDRANLFQQLAEAASDGIGIADLNANFIYLNPALVKMFGGQDVQEFVGHSLAEFYPRDQQPLMRGQVLPAVLNSGRWSGDLEILNKQTGRLPVLVNSFLIRDDNGAPLYLASILSDISERKEAESRVEAQVLERTAQLAASEERFRSLYERSADAILILGANRFVECNQAALEMFQFNDRNLMLTLHPSDISPAQQPDGRSSMEKADEMIGIAIERGSNRFEWMHKRLDGEVFPAEVILTPIETGDANILVYAVVRDITEARRNEQALRVQEEKFRTVADFTYDWEYWLGPERTFLYVSPASERISGYTPDEFIQDAGLLNRIIHPDDRHSFEDHVNTYHNPENFEVGNIELRIINRAGEEVWLDHTCTSVHGQAGNFLGRRASNREITERKQLEQAVRDSMQRRGIQVELSTRIAQAITAAPDLPTLFNRVVTQVKERFGYYHVQILRFDPSQNAVVLVSGYGDIGQQMQAAGHRLPVGTGLIGTAAVTGQVVLRSTLADDPDWRPNPLLPDTRGEIAVPIKLRDEMLGVLDVQSDQPGLLSADDQLLLEGICGQIAAAVESTRLRAQTEERLKELDRLYRTTSREGWQSFRETGSLTSGYVYDLTNVQVMQSQDVISSSQQLSDATSFQAESDNADSSLENNGRLPVDTAGIAANSVPLTVRGELIGELGVIHDPDRPLTEEERLLVELVSDQVAQALEGARLFEQTQSSLAETRALYAGSAQIISATDLDQVIHALVRTTPLSGMDRVSVEYFDRSWIDNPPEYVMKAAEWQRSAESSPQPVGTTFRFSDLPILYTLRREEPAVYRDIRTDSRVDLISRSYALNTLQVISLTYWPLVAGGEWFGVLAAESNSSLQFSADEIRRIFSLVSQAATVVQSLRLQQDMRQRVFELTALQRLMSREAWIAYQSQSVNVGDTSRLGYLFDRFDTRPLAASLEMPDAETDRIRIDPAETAGTALTSGNGNGHGGVSTVDKEPDQARSTIPEPVSGGPASVVDPLFMTPLSVRGEAIGMLGIPRDAGLGLSMDDEAFLQAVSEQVAQALERARLMEQTQKSAVELQAVAEVGTATATILEPEELLQQVVDLAKERFGLYHAHVYLLNEQGTDLMLAAGAARIGRSMVAEGWSIPVEQDDSLVAYVARTRQGHIIADIRRELGHLVNPLLPDTRSELAVPMIVADNLLGVFDVQSSVPNWFREEDVRTYSTLSAQISVALQNARLYAEQLAAVERLRELDNMKSAFLANMSHELRTPLNSILGFTQVVMEGLDGPLTDLMSSDLELIEKNGRHLLTLINDILDMAKIEAGRLTLTPEPMNIYELLDEVIITNGNLARDRNLFINLEADPSEDWMIMADTVRLRQIFINLIGNSVKFTEKGGITVDLDKRLVRDYYESGYLEDMVQIRIRDSGIGIPPDKLEEIFEAFSQVDSSTTRKVGGTGLGLPISRRLVEMHGGRLWAESQGLNRGSTFFLELPIARKTTK
jgi:PAS domain S-box-containing protein